MKARRGDLVVIERKTSYVTTSDGWHESTEYDVGIVTSITRDGLVKACKTRYADSVPMDHIHGYLRSFIVPQSEIDVVSAVEAARANEWSSGHTGKPFDSLDEVRDVLRPFKTKAAA